MGDFSLVFFVGDFPSGGIFNWGIFQINILSCFKNQFQNQLLNLRPLDTDKVLGLFAPSHMQYKLLSQGSNEPSLAEMTEKALEMMRNNEEGFVLLVEGGRIDHAHHVTTARLALEETLEFEKAIDVVRRMTLEEDTLVVVTSDHGHVFTVGGYAVSKLALNSQ